MKCPDGGSVPTRESRSPQGERGLKCEELFCEGDEGDSRSPQGERGLKFSADVASMMILLSLSARRAWIEISSAVRDGCMAGSRSPQGERGLKWRIWP